MDAPAIETDVLVSTESQRNLLESTRKGFVVEPSIKLKCLVYVLSLIALGFIVTLTEANFDSNVQQSNCLLFPNNTVNPDSALNSSNGSRADTQLNLNEYVCLSIKCAYLLSGIVAIVYLQRVVLVEGTIPEAIESHPSQENRLIVLRNFLRCIKIPKSIGSYPSALFILTFIIFSMTFCLESGIDITCGIIDSMKKPGKNLPDVFRRTLLTIFIIMQTKLFVIHFRHSAQWKLSATWFCGCQLLATNIASWFFNVGLELRELMSDEKNVSARHENDSELSYCLSNNIRMVSHLLYPFGIEYYVMSALMAFNLVATAGRLGAFVRSHISELPNAEASRASVINIEPLLHSNPRRETPAQVTSEFSLIRKHFHSFALGLGLTTMAVLVSVFVLLNKDKSSSHAIHCVFLSALVLLYSCGVVCTNLLLCFINKTNRHDISIVHLTDRLLLWLGAAAIAVHECNKLWSTIVVCVGKHFGSEMTLELTNDILLVTSSTLNIYQSLMQVYAIECVLLWKFRPPSGRGMDGRALLNLLILLNAAEWIISSVCLKQFIIDDTKGNNLVLSLVTVPLQVFYRFHSVTCIHEFKRHCEPDIVPVEAAGAAVHGPMQDVIVDLSTMPSLMDTIHRRR